MNSYNIFKAALELIKYLTPTPFIHSKYLSEKTGANIFLKLETFQFCNTFKTRGALNQLLNINKNTTNIVIASNGVFGYILSNFCLNLGYKLTVVMPETGDFSYIKPIKKNQASVVVHGNNFKEAFEFAKNFADFLFVPNEHSFYGYGTIAYEMLKTHADLNYIFVESGPIANAVESYAHAHNPTINVISVEKLKSNTILSNLIKLEKCIDEFLKNEKILIDMQTAHNINDMIKNNISGKKVGLIVTSTNSNKNKDNIEKIIEEPFLSLFPNNFEEGIIDIKPIGKKTRVIGSN